MKKKTKKKGGEKAPAAPRPPVVPRTAAEFRQVIDFDLWTKNLVIHDLVPCGRVEQLLTALGLALRELESRETELRELRDAHHVGGKAAKASPR